MGRRALARGCPEPLLSSAAAVPQCAGAREPGAASRSYRCRDDACHRARLLQRAEGGAAA
eukprot:scaffold48415_cov61-Phaeocystis_antarctica.AAC.6